MAGIDKKINLFEYIEDHTLRLEASHRGGGIEIDAAEILGLEGAKLTAYQNYLGGGMLGSVQSDCNIRDWQSTELAPAIRDLAEALKRYFYNYTNDIVEDWDEWAASSSYEAHQATRPASAY